MKKRISILFVLLCLFICIFSVNPVIAEETEDTDTSSETFDLEETDPEEELAFESEEGDLTEQQDPPASEEEDPADEIPAPEKDDREIVFEDVVFVIPEGFEVKQKDVEGKENLREEGLSSGLSGLVEGVDCKERELFFLADDEEYARQVAEIYHSELSSFHDGVAVITIKDDALSVNLAAEASLNIEDLPLVEPNYIIRLDPPIEYHEFSSGYSAFGESLSNNYGWEEWIYDWFGESADPYLTNPSDKYDFQWQHEFINTYAGWNTTMGQNVVVAVLDEGINPNHEEFADKYMGIVYVNDIGQGTSFGTGHGNHVAGIIGAAVNNKAGGAGIAPYASLLSINMFDETGDSSDAVLCAAINRAIVYKADIINMSIGNYWYSEAANQVIQNAYQKGVVMVAAAGNEGTDLKNFPAAYDHVIAVAATTRNGAKAAFSNFGSWVTIAAPGANIPSAYSTASAPQTNTYELGSGTSQATPVVSGALALYMSKMGHIDYDEAVKVLKNTARKSSSSQIGYGVVSVENMFKKISTAPEIHVSRPDGVEYTSGELSQPVEPGSYVVIYNPNEGNFEQVIYTTNGKKPSIKNNEVVNGEVCHNGEGNFIYLDDFDRGKTITINAAIVNGMGVLGKNASIKIKTPLVQTQDVRIKTLALDKGSVTLQKYHDASSEPWEDHNYTIVNISTLIDSNGSFVDLSDFDSGIEHIWLTSNEKVCKVEDLGNGQAMIYATGTGSAKVTLKILDGSDKSAVVKVTAVQLAEEVQISGRQAVAAGESTTYKVTVLPSNTKNKKVDWGILYSENPDVKISSEGRLTVPKNATAGQFIIIKATPKDDSNQKNVGAYHVIKVCGKASAVWITRDESWNGWYEEYGIKRGRMTFSKTGALSKVTLFTLDINDSMNPYVDNQVKLDAYIEAGEDYDIPPVWTSSNTKVATVDQDGLIKAVSAGTAKITCTANDGSKKKASVTVKVVVPASSLSLNNLNNRYNDHYAYLGFGKTVDLKKCLGIGKQYGKPTSIKVRWVIDYVGVRGDDNDYTDIMVNGKTKYVTVSSDGKLKVSPKAKEKLGIGSGDLYVMVKAYTTDTTGYSDYLEYTINDPITSVKFQQKSYQKEVGEGSGNGIFYSFGFYANEFSHFEVKSSNPSIGSGAVEYMNTEYDDETGMYLYSVTFINNSNRKGSITLTVKALDGSEKTASTKITFK